MGLYLDNAATTPLLPEVKDFILKNLDVFGNPNSDHSVGDKAYEVVRNATKKVASLINCDAEDIIFTCGGSASNTLAIRGFCDATKDSKILYSPICHKSIIEAAKHMPHSEPLGVDSTGKIDICDLTTSLKINSSYYNILIVVDFGNSEIGTIQDIRLISEIVHRYGGLIYVDCTGSIPYIPLDVQKMDVDMAGFSAHKLGALKGCGVLYKKKAIELSPLIFGARGVFSGTENVLGIGALGVAAELQQKYYGKIDCEKRRIIYEGAKKYIPDCYLVGHSDDRLPYNVNICFPGVNAGDVVHLLDDWYKIQCSTGSACNSQSSLPSPPLAAINEKNPLSCVRFSLSGREQDKELRNAVLKIVAVVEALKDE